MAEQDRLRLRRLGVELTQKGLEHHVRAVVAGMAGEIGAIAVTGACPEEKNLYAGLSAGLMHGDGVRLADASQVDVVLRLDSGQRPDAVAVGGGLFEFLDVTSVLHQ